MLDGLRAGRVYVSHGGLVGGVDVSVRNKGDRRPGSPLGSVVTPRRGERLELAISMTLPTLPNWAQFVPKLARVDVIQGAVTGAASDRDTFRAPNTKVVTQRDVSGRDRPGRPHLRPRRGRRAVLRAGPGNRRQAQAVGLNGAAVDPAGPAADVKGDADPWNDLWFYTNPIWVLPR